MNSRTNGSRAKKSPSQVARGRGEAFEMDQQKATPWQRSRFRCDRSYRISSVLVIYSIEVEHCQYLPDGLKRIYLLIDSDRRSSSIISYLAEASVKSARPLKAQLPKRHYLIAFRRLIQSLHT